MFLAGLVIVAFFLLPIIWIISTSLKSTAEAFEVPPKILFMPKFDSYESLMNPSKAAWQGVVRFSHTYYNTLIVSFGTAVITLAIGVPAGYAFSRYRFRGSRDLQFWVLSTIMAPPMGIIVPYYLIISWLGLLDTHAVLIILYTGINLPFMIWNTKSFFDSIPSEVFEAADMDGASEAQKIIKIALPAVREGALATSALVFVLAWEEFLLGHILTASVARTTTSIMASFVQSTGPLWAELSAAATMVMLPPMVLFIIIQKYLAGIMTLGAVKG
jgi:multiple sugar transport system permease protein